METIIILRKIRIVLPQVLPLSRVEMVEAPLLRRVLRLHWSDRIGNRKKIVIGVMVSEFKKGIERRLDEWRLPLERRGMQISRTKTKYMMCTKQEQERRESIRLDGVELERVDAFKYLESTLSADSSEDKDISGKIQAVCNS